MSERVGVEVETVGTGSRLPKGPHDLTSSGFLVTLLDPTTASETELTILNAFENTIHSEVWSDAGTLPLEQTISRLRSSPPHFHHYLWTVTRGDRNAILAIARTIHFEHDTHLMHFDVSVLPEMRDRGLARMLLGQVAETAGRMDRQLLQARTFSTVPSGVAFLEHLGARLGRTRHISQLEIARLDLDQLRVWKSGHGMGSSFEIGMWQGPYPRGRSRFHVRTSPGVFESVRREDSETRRNDSHGGKIAASRGWSAKGQDRSLDDLRSRTEDKPPSGLHRDALDPV
ncbi:MAG: hypothetical protein CME26_01505 [Gemmatimonadetes bacterium]|nr:hypothetical protein [Gemmatimonadota bacterium]